MCPLRPILSFVLFLSVACIGCGQKESAQPSGLPSTTSGQAEPASVSPRPPAAPPQQASPQAATASELTALASSENNRISHKSIHDVDVKEFVTTHYSELDPNLEILKEECEEGQDPIRSVEIQYGDVDGDGQEEALFQGYTCMAGTSGVDYSGIVKLQPSGKLVGLPIAPAPDAFKGRKPFEGLRGHVRLSIENGRFVETYPVYTGDECEACSSGGQRKFVFRWNGHEFALDDIINVPPDQAGN